MAHLSLKAVDLDISLPDQESLIISVVDMRVNWFLSGENEDAPTLSINLCTQQFYLGGGHELTFYVDGYEDIDALRRYCEMALDHYEKGRLK